MIDKTGLKISLVNIALNEDAPPINLAYLSAALKIKGFMKVRIIDYTFRRSNLRQEVEDSDLIGISAMTKYYDQARAWARRIKKIRNVPVVIGGSHITTLPDSLSPDFDLGVIGEGEAAIVELCRLLQDEGAFLPQRLKDIGGLVYRDKGNLVCTQPPDHIRELDSIAMPDYAALDKNYFKRKFIIWSGRRGRSMKIMTSRGCPYNCIFCASKNIWKNVRLHSAERMFQEVSELSGKRGVDHIYIDDDLFIVDQGRLQEFSLLMERGGLEGKISFFCSVRSNSLDDRACLILKKIGVKVLNFGFESGSDKMLKALKGGNISVESHKNAIRLCNKYGFRIWGSVMLGSPGETLDDMKKTSEFIDYAIGQGSQRLGVFVATPLPGTEFWETAKKRNAVSDDMDWGLIDYANSRKPFLLEPEIDAKVFDRIFSEVKAKADRLLLQGGGFRAIILRSRKALSLFRREPGRVFYLLKNMLNPRGLTDAHIK